MPLTTDQKLAIYRNNLERYQAEGKEEQVQVQKRLIERLERDN